MVKTRGGRGHDRASRAAMTEPVHARGREVVTTVGKAFSAGMPGKSTRALSPMSAMTKASGIMTRDAVRVARFAVAGDRALRSL
ncbi:MAG: hypothetical protein MZV70_42305 [Desulfobacterales bacterium]|nr:hypothetical protein [Desulfobacterales bacterium]